MEQGIKDLKILAERKAEKFSALAPFGISCASVVGLVNRIDELEKELTWAWKNLKYTGELLSHAEFDYCVICMNPEYDHKEDCKALQHKEIAKKLVSLNP